MKELLRIKLVTIVILLASAGCRKDSPVDVTTPPTDTSDMGVVCEDFPPESIFSWNMISTGSQHRMPCYNPNDQNEIIYIREIEGQILPELVKYNINSKSEVVLLNDLNIQSAPKWSKTGWIVFHLFSGVNQVWKVRDDGTDLTQLTFGSSDLYPNFNATGDRIVYFRGTNYSNSELEENPDLYLEAKMIFLNLEGEVIDSILIENIISQTKGGQFYYQNWKYAEIQLEETYLIGGTDNFYGIYKATNDYEELEEIHVWDLSVAPRQDASSLAYSDGFLYYTKGKNSLYKLNTDNGIVEMMREGCDTKNYNHVVVSPDGKKLLVEKIISTVIDSETIDEQREIWTIDIATNHENPVLTN